MKNYQQLIKSTEAGYERSLVVFSSLAGFHFMRFSMEATLPTTDRAGQTTGAVTSANNSNNQDGKTYRLIPLMKVAQQRRAMDGAERRMLRLETELVECRAIIRRKYTDVLDKNEEVVGHNRLSSEQVFGFRLKRTQIEKELALAKRDYFRTRKSYRSSVTNNFQVERKAVKLILEESRLRRESQKLLRDTVEILEQHGNNGGAKEMEVLTSLALKGDIKAFRSAFDQTVARFDPSHFKMISGVSNVKTEIIHGVMELLAEEATKKDVSPDESVR